MALNNESIVEKDLVAWVMLGIVHVPRSEVSVLSLPVLHSMTRVPCHLAALCLVKIHLRCAMLQ